MVLGSLDRCITGYAEFFDEGGWDATGSELPKLLFINEKGTTERRVRRTVQAALDRVDMTDEIEIYTTTYAALQNTVEPHAIWTSIDDPDELLPLGAL